MTVLRILEAPHPRLRSISSPIPDRVWKEAQDTSPFLGKRITAKWIRQLIFNMFDTMYASNGVSLAAPQVGVSFRIIVLDVEQKDLQTVDGLWPVWRKPVVIINPVMTAFDGSIQWNEGCLSVPGCERVVERYAKIVVEGLDHNGTPLRIKAEKDLLAVCLQHEIDHLDGILLTDR